MSLTIIGAANHCIFEYVFSSFASQFTELLRNHEHHDGHKHHDGHEEHKHHESHLGSNSPHKHDDASHSHQHGNPHEVIAVRYGTTYLDSLQLVFISLLFTGCFVVFFYRFCLSNSHRKPPPPDINLYRFNKDLIYSLTQAAQAPPLS